VALTKRSRDAIEALDALEGFDGEALHARADDILLDAVPVEVREAYDRVVERAGFWVTA
jgi:hypothetical protein